MCPPGCHHNGFMATPELGHRISKSSLLFAGTKPTHMIRGTVNALLTDATYYIAIGRYPIPHTNGFCF